MLRWPKRLIANSYLTVVLCGSNHRKQVAVFVKPLQVRRFRCAYHRRWFVGSFGVGACVLYDISLTRFLALVFAGLHFLDLKTKEKSAARKRTFINNLE